MRVERGPVADENGVFYLLRDHLGSASVTVKEDSGALTKYAELRYKPWGEDRPASEAFNETQSPSERRFTGQRAQDELGLYYYQARWYDPALGRFVQPDSIEPDPGNPLDWDRYSYAQNNPLRFIDPTGHAVECAEQSGGSCSNLSTPETIINHTQYTLEKRFWSEHDLSGTVREFVLHFEPLYRGKVFSWALTNLLLDPTDPVALADFAYISLSNLSTGLLAASMGGDLAPVGGVYKITNANGVVVRVGRTNNLTRRASEHSRNPNLFDLDFRRVYLTDDYATQRGLEQLLYDRYNPPMNYIRPINKTNRNRTYYKQAAIDFLNDLYNVK